MYYLFIIVLLILSFLAVARGVQIQRQGLIGAGAALAAATVLFFIFLSFWAEKLWFDAAGYSARFWTAILAQVISAVGGLLLAAAVVWLGTWALRGGTQRFRIGAVIPGGMVGCLWGMGNWDVLLRFWYGLATETNDPIFGLNTGFYLFVLPFLDRLYWLLLLTAFVSLFTTVAQFAWRNLELTADSAGIEWTGNQPQDPFQFLYVVGFLGLVVTFGIFLSGFHLLLSTGGVVTGAGWTDVHIRLPAYYVVAFLTAAGSVVLLVPNWSRKLSRTISRRYLSPQQRPFVAFVPVVVYVAVWFLAVGLAPALVQWLAVEPNEITMERPYIAHNIKFTRQGFHLAKVEEKQFPVSQELTQEVIANNQHVLSEVRLWDPRALDSVYEQFQEIRLYYEFHDVDTDRYVIDGKYRQVMVSARELQLANLPAESQTFVNRHFKYTHGYGITLAPASDFTDRGLPNLLVKDIPPKSVYPELEVKRPEIYYGELTRTYAVVNSQEEEFDYPKGEKNAYVRYAGKGGVPLHNWWRQLIYGWHLGGTRLLLSTYPKASADPNAGSRIMFHRQIHERVKTLAPFLEFDQDAYIVLADGKLYWMIDGYTTSSYYPYSEPYFSGESISYEEEGQSRALHTTGVAPYLHGVNYVRNSVKAVVDAYNGSVDFYIFEPDDPLIQVWQRIYPGLFKSRDQMPDSLEEHIRYPEGLLLAQGLVYAKYHMTDPGVFYNQEDLWVRATEKYYADVQAVEPYYVMWEPPGKDEAEFVLMQPFTPKKRQVLIGWIAGMCDPGNYGRLLAYRFPKEKRVLGTQQIESKIDQDSKLSVQLSLWDQRGSRVIRGNVLVIPINSTVLYVEPIYLKAEAAAYPELRLVTIMHNDKLSYDKSFDKALNGLFKEGTEPVLPGPKISAEGSLSELAKQANEAFENYLRFQNDREFAKAAAELEKLQAALEKMVEQSPPKQP